MQDVYIEGRWQPADAITSFQADCPGTGEPLPTDFPVCGWDICERTLIAAEKAARAMHSGPPDAAARFLERYAERIDSHAEQICEAAAEETALPISPRLLDVELPRTTNQLRVAAAAARSNEWRLPTIDDNAGLASGYDALGPVVVFGPNNFPLAFNAVSGGDFAAAIAAGNPVIAKAHPDHPYTTLLLAQLASEAAAEVRLPDGSLQVLWGLENQTGLRMVADPRVGAVGFTGSRGAGLSLKRAADAVGTPFYAEMSSVNPVFFLGAAVTDHGAKLAEDFAGSVLLGAGQFCTCPNIAVVDAGSAGQHFINAVRDRFLEAPGATLLSQRVAENLHLTCERLLGSGAELVCGGAPAASPRSAYQATLLRVDATRFLGRPEAFQTEGFGPMTLVVMIESEDEWGAVAEAIEGSLTGGVYFESPEDDTLRDRLSESLRRRVGRLLHNKMPTGVAVSPAMNHGGPFPASSHPGFTAVGFPAAMRRFAKLDCYDNVAPPLRPFWLRRADTSEIGRRD